MLTVHSMSRFRDVVRLSVLQVRAFRYPNSPMVCEWSVFVVVIFG